MTKQGDDDDERVRAQRRPGGCGSCVAHNTRGGEGRREGLSGRRPSSLASLSLFALSLSLSLSQPHNAQGREAELLP